MAPSTEHASPFLTLFVSKNKSIVLLTIVTVSMMRVVVGELVDVGDSVGANIGGHDSRVHTLHGIIDGV